jgi:DedD protein
MRPVLDHDHDLLGEDAPPTDLVLGAPALLGIFFALALICAVCFGFGYSSGHGLHLPNMTRAAAPTTAATAKAALLKPSSDPLTPEDGEIAATDGDNAGQNTNTPATQQVDPPAAAVAAHAASKPVPGVDAHDPTSTSSAVASSAAASSAGATTPTSSVTTRVANPPAPQQAYVSSPTVRPGAAASSTVGPNAAPAGTPTATSSTLPAPTLPQATASAAPAVNLMVQIAAVSHAADAATLATALRHDGFAAIVRTTTGDPFFHVQVGPFASRDAAKAMRARLASSGYNAFIKQ